MRRLALLFAGGAVWLFLAAIPAFADGGPHVASVNNGSGGLTADSCAGCHRAHTAQNDVLLVQASTTDLCLSCHGAGATGATTNVVNGVQYYPVGTQNPSTRNPSLVILGALRNGGFETAAIGSSDGARLAYLSGTSVRELPKVPVNQDANGALATQPVTSTHFNLADPEAVLTAWGNGAVDTSVNGNAGGTGNMDCATCHNPHGNGQYRILNTIPQMTGGTFTTSTTPVAVTDAPLPPSTDTRNYTVIQAQTGGTSTTLLASGAAAYSNTAGDYFHRRVPWNASTSGTYTNDQPNGQASTFNAQINAWCVQCHTRYLSSGAANTSGDTIFHNQHFTGSNVVCTTCHVAHGSNAQMTGTYSANETYPGGAAAPVGDSRLLKLDNRGTCQACHDPTGTITAGTLVGPTPVPLVP